MFPSNDPKLGESCLFTKPGTVTPVVLIFMGVPVRLMECVCRPMGVACAFTLKGQFK